VVIDNFGIARVVVVPDESQAVLFIDADRVLSGAFLRERFQRIAGGAKIAEASGLVQLDELSEPRLFDGLKFAAVLALKDLFRFRAPK
jgi:hypothetical protein